MVWIVAITFILDIIAVFNIWYLFLNGKANDLFASEDERSVEQ